MSDMMTDPMFEQPAKKRKRSGKERQQKKEEAIAAAAAAAEAVRTGVPFEIPLPGGGPLADKREESDPTDVLPPDDMKMEEPDTLEIEDGAGEAMVDEPSSGVIDLDTVKGRVVSRPM
jgi:hypothetical protein